MNLIDYTDKYLSIGTSIIPIREKGKEAAIPWKKYQDQAPKPDEANKWFSNSHLYNVGMVMGKVSKVFCVDIDGENGIQALSDAGIDLDEEPTWLQKSNRGHHYFFQYPEDGIPNKVFEGGEIRSDGTYIVVAPSVHPSGTKYEWKVSPFDLAPAYPNEALIQFAKQNDNKTKLTQAPKAEGQIFEGSRNNTLTSIAGTNRRRGLGYDEILALLIVTNQKRCVSPLPNSDIKKISRSVCKYEPDDPQLDHFGFKANTGLNKLNRSDAGNAEAIALLFGQKIRYNHTSGRWLIFNGNIWEVDEKNEIKQFAVQAVRERLRASADINDTQKRERAANHALASENNNRLNAALDIAKGLTPIAATKNDFDNDPFFIGTENGVLNLTNGELYTGTPEHMISKSLNTSFDSSARCDRWEKFVEEIMDDDPTLVNFLQMASGYTLTGDVKEQVLFFLHGFGANGKSTFLEVISYLLGDYSKSINFHTLESSINNSNKMTNDVAELAGKRLVIANEVKEHSALNEARIKSLTGGDTITARHLYKDEFSFDPSFKIWLSANHKPKVDDNSYAFWRRIRLVPFEKSFKGDQCDKGLKNKLLDELPGILNWMIDGCVFWQKEGLTNPEKIQNATTEYQNESDIVFMFLKDRTIRKEGATVLSQSLFETFINWTKETGEKEMKRNMFGRKLSGLGIESKPDTITRRATYLDLGLIE